MENETALSEEENETVTGIVQWLLSNHNSGTCPDFYGRAKDCQRVADFLRCPVLEIEKLTPEDFRRYLICAVADEAAERYRDEHRFRRIA